MIRRFSAGRLAASLGLGAFLAIPLGCSDGAPPVDTSSAQATVHGVVKLAGVPIEGGEIRFDPSNIKRRDAPIATAEIGKDGTYKITTLEGENVVRFNLPASVLKKNQMLASFSTEYKVPSGDSAFDVEIK